MGIYAEIQNNTITNTVICDATFAAEYSLTEIDGLTPQPGVGWTLAAGVWSPPAIPPQQVNQTTIEQNLEAQLKTIETWITNNPNGAILTAAQTLVLARMIAGLTRGTLGLYDSVGGS